LLIILKTILPLNSSFCGLLLCSDEQLADGDAAAHDIFAQALPPLMTADLWNDIDVVSNIWSGRGGPAALKHGRSTACGLPCRR
jgi:hypothetical protein